MKFNISDIIVKDRKRELGNIETLAQSIKELGLLNPITIQPNGVLIAGYHRLEACKSLGWNEIDVNIVNLEVLQAEMAEIDENLIRNELHWFDRDKQLARRKEIYEAIHPETKHGGDRKSEEAKSNGNNFHSIPSFTEDTASKIGVTDRTVRSSIQRAEAFTEEQGEILKHADIKPTEATKIAALPETERTSHLMQIMSSSETPEWYTPERIIKLVTHLFGEIDLDPCSNSHDAPNVPAKTHYTKDDDGLSQPWHGKVYMNPPYGTEIPQWTQKLLEEYSQGRIKEAIALVPGRIDTAWFQPLYEHLICNIKGRLQFSAALSGAPFPSVAIYIGERKEAFIEAFKDAGPIVQKVS